MSEAAQVLGVSERQAYRIKKDILREGVKGAVHGNRGRRCAWRVSEEVKARIVKLRREKYAGFNDTHFTEKLELEGIAMSRERVRQILREGGIASPRRRRRGKYRKRREPSAGEGLMLQTDGSDHDWLEGRGPRLCLVGAIDDATKKVPAALFRPTETTEAYFGMFEKAFRKQGLCHSVYADRHSMFYTDREPTVEEQLAGKRKAMTELGRAFDELGITLIPAGSPQAKGRIERLWGTFQDRLVSELRLADARTLEEAQTVLDRFLPAYNRRFAVRSKNAASAWREIPEDVDLKRILCWKRRRTVARDNTISLNGITLQLPGNKTRHSLAGKVVDILILRDKTVEVFYKKMKVAAFTGQQLQMAA